MSTIRGSAVQAAARRAVRSVALLVAGLGLASEALSAQPRMQRTQARPAPFMERAVAGRAMAESSFVERILRAGDRLNLSAEQREQLNAMRIEAVERRTARAARWMKMASEVRAGLREPAELRETAGEGREEMASQRQAVRSSLEEVLTDEQRRLLRQRYRRAGLDGIEEILTDEQRRQLREFRVRSALRQREMPGRAWRGWRGGRGREMERGRRGRGGRWER